MIKNFLAFLIWAFICMPALVVGIFVIPIMLLCGWKGYSTLWGNDTWGDGSTHPDHGSTTFFGRFNWLALRNPTSNLGTRYLSAPDKPYVITDGTTPIGEKVAAGFYWAKMGWAWEFYYIKPYTIFGSRRCIRFRSGWKIVGGRRENGKVAFCFAINPVKAYSGV